jgi:5-deoxy-glucuronate isomerase
MPNLHIPCIQDTAGLSRIVGPVKHPLKRLTISRIVLDQTLPEINFETKGSEAVLDIFGGVCTVSIRTAAREEIFAGIGGRANVFAGRPTMVYIPKNADVSINAESTGFEAVLMSAPAENEHPAVLIGPKEAVSREIGKDNWRRTVVTSIGENVRADRLIVGETTNPPGNWSSAPPHKHDKRGDGEVPMEEVYVYKFNPLQGFGLQRVYTAPGDSDPFDVTYAVSDGDAVILPRGYHPVVAAPGYQLFYLWVLAGDERKYGAWSDDPEHAWIKDA